MPTYTGTVVQTQDIEFSSVEINEISGDLTVSGNVITSAPTQNNHATTKNYVDVEVAGIVDSAPELLNTLNELSAALNDDENFATTINNSIALKAPIASPTFTGTVTVPTPSNNTDAVTKAYTDDALSFKAPLASPTFTGTVTVPTPAGSTDATTKGYVDNALDLKAPLASPTFTGTVTIPTPSNDTDPTTKLYVDTALALKSPIASPTFTGTVTIPTPSNATDAATKGYVDTGLALKSPLDSPTFTGTVTVPTPSNSTDAATKGYADTALALKANIDAPTFTGTVSLDNDLSVTGDASISNVQIGVSAGNEIDTSSGDLVIDSAGGTVTIDDNLTVSGNLIVNGTTSTVNSSTITVDDPVFTLGGDSAPASDDNKDRGVEFRWHNGTTAKLGFFGFDDSTGHFTFIPDATNTSEVFSGTQGSVDAAGYYISGTSVLNSTTLGSGITSSSLTSVGTITSGTWNGSTIAVANGGTGVTALSSLNAADLGSNDGSSNATQDYVLTADGSGGAAWAEASGGSGSDSIYLNSGDSYSKLRLNGDSATYSIGYSSGVSFAVIGTGSGTPTTGNAITFQVDNDNTDGFYWRDTGHTAAQGLMALNTQGNLTVANSIKVGFGESDNLGHSSSYRLWVSGEIYATGNITAYSDGRAKENIRPIANALELVSCLDGVYFNMIEDENKKSRIGVIAQDVEEYLPEVVIHDEELDVYSVDYGNITALLIEAVKELRIEVNELRSKLNEEN